MHRRSVAFPVTSSGAIGATGANVILGVLLTETGGSSNCTVTFRDQGSNSGNLLGTIVVPKGTTLPFSKLPDIYCNGQVYVGVSGGTLAGTVYLA